MVWGVSIMWQRHAQGAHKDQSLPRRVQRGQGRERRKIGDRPCSWRCGTVNKILTLDVFHHRLVVPAMKDSCMGYANDVIRFNRYCMYTRNLRRQQHMNNMGICKIPSRYTLSLIFCL